MLKGLAIGSVFLMSSGLGQAETKFSRETLEGQKLFLRETVNSNRKVYVHLAGRTAYYIHQEGPLFPVSRSEAVTIEKVKVQVVSR